MLSTVLNAGLVHCWWSIFKQHRCGLFTFKVYSLICWAFFWLQWNEKHWCNKVDAIKCILELMFTFTDPFVNNCIYILKYISKYSLSHRWNEIKNNNLSLCYLIFRSISTKYYYWTVLNSPSQYDVSRGNTTH